MEARSPGLACLGDAARGRESPRLEPGPHPGSAGAGQAGPAPCRCGWDGWWGSCCFSGPPSPQHRGGPSSLSEGPGEGRTEALRLAPLSSPRPRGAEPNGAKVQNAIYWLQVQNLGSEIRHPQWAGRPGGSRGNRGMGRGKRHSGVFPPNVLPMLGSSWGHQMGGELHLWGGRKQPEGYPLGMGERRGWFRLREPSPGAGRPS